MSAKAQRERPEIEPVNLKDALGERYLAYALSTITSRSLPDVRDGLKPVQRRILYAMRELRLDPASGYKKCARVVGDVIGKFHPHGDVAVYDALVRLAQDFSQRYPLVDGQGNFGNIDGDNAAAMRYTETRMTAVAAALLDGIDQETVDFRDTYDGSEDEPVVLPAAFPNLLANGASGIAVGMATNIPPHNVGELFAALIHLLERPIEAGAPSVAEMMQFVQGPDLPTGGVLIENRATILQAYETGRGSLRIRAHYEVEKLGHGQYQLIVTEIPYHVQKSRLIERLAELLAAKKLPHLTDLRDESTEDIRIVLIPRSRTVPPEVVMEQLFRQSDLEVRLSLNMNVLDAQGVPRVMTLVEMLQAFIEHRMEVLIRRSNFRLRKIDERLEILEGYLKAFLDIDRVIQIIRESDEPKPELMAEFELTERQAEAVLNLRLRNLRKLEEMELKTEQKQLKAERRDIKSLLADEGLRRQRLAAEMRARAQEFGDPRRTRIEQPPSIDLALLEAPVERFAVTIICSAKGWIRVVRGHQIDQADIKYKEGDKGRFVIEGQSSDKLLAIADDGRVYTINIDKLPSGRGQGEPLSMFLDLAKAAEIANILVFNPTGKILFATHEGRGFVAEMAEMAAQTKNGKQIINVADKDRLIVVRPVQGDSVAVVSTNRKLLVFALEEVPILARGRGVILQRYRDGYLADATTFGLDEGLSWPTGSRRRHEKDLTMWIGRRGSVGRNVPQGFPRGNRFGGDD